MKNTPEALIEAASAVFAQKGFQNANVEDICKQAGANLSAINYHFGGKKKLYLRVLAEASALADRDIPLLTEAPAGVCPRERLAAFMTSQFLRISCDGPAGRFSRMLVHEMTNPSFAHDHIHQRYISRMRNYLDALLRELLPTDIPDPFVWVCHFNIVSLFTFPMIIRTIHHSNSRKKHPNPPAPEDMARSAISFALGGIDAIIDAAAKGQAPPAIFPPPDHHSLGEEERQ